MSRILGIDYGTKRTGIAVTDPLQIIASGLTTVPTHELFDFIANYLKEEEVEAIVVGEPMHPDGNPAQIAGHVRGFVTKLRKQYPTIQVFMQDERYTSLEAKQVILQSGVNRKKRQDKALVDKVAAALILEDYLNNKQ